MSGIVGFTIDESSYIRVEEGTRILNLMSNNLINYKQDFSKEWINTKENVYIMVSDMLKSEKKTENIITNRFVTSFYGDIYNMTELISDIYIYGSNQDDSAQDIISRALDKWGIDETLKRIEGSFAIAIYDKKESKLYLVRDRIGEKTLYYGLVDGGFIFSTELRVFKKYPLFKGEIDRNVLRLYFKHNYIPAPYSIYENIFKLKPGTYISLNLETKEIEEKKYWYPQKNIKDQTTEQNNYTDELESLLHSAIEKRIMRKDDSVGAFLSGGVDSSTIAAIMQSTSEDAVNTFSIGFIENEYDEAKSAKEVGNYLGTNHRELYITSKDALEVIPSLPLYYDEPFADSSQIPTYLASKFAKEYVNTVLSGDGGDELFSGYERYSVINNLSNKLDKVPFKFKKQAATLINNIELSRFGDNISRKYPRKSDHLYRLRSLLEIKEKNDLYEKFITSITDDIVLNNNGIKLPYFINTEESLSFFKNQSYIDWMSYVDLNMGLSDDGLIKVNKAAIANDLKVRIPLLDQKIIEFSMNLPSSYKIKEGHQKWILKQVMYKYLPKELMDRPKKGFGVPIAAWLRGPLNEWANNLLDEKKIKEQGYLDVEKVRMLWSEHSSGKRNWQAQLWGILMFQAWLEKQ